MLGAWSLEHICSGGVKRPQEAHELGVDEKREERIGGEKRKKEVWIVVGRIAWEWEHKSFDVVL